MLFILFETYLSLSQQITLVALCKTETEYNLTVILKEAVEVIFIGRPPRVNSQPDNGTHQLAPENSSKSCRQF